MARSTVRLPLGLDELEAKIRVPASQLDFGKFSGIVRQKEVFVASSRPRMVRAILGSAGSLSGAHAHFELREDQERKQFVASMALVPGTHGRSKEKPRSIPYAIDAFRNSWTDVPDRVRMLVSAHYSLSMKEWIPTVPLPFTPLAMTGGIAGTPQICGVDIAFQDQSSSQFLQRAFITTYDGIDRIVIRMLLAFSAPLQNSLVKELVALADEHLPLLARPREGEAT